MGQQMQDALDRLAAQLDDGELVLASSGPMPFLDLAAKTVAGLRAEIATLREQPRLRGMESGRFIADDGDGEREEFDTLKEARDWAVEQITRYRDDARTDGEWPESVNGVTVWVALEQAQETIDEGGGSEFELTHSTSESPPTRLDESSPLKTPTENPIEATEAEHRAECLAQLEEDKAQAITDRLVDVIESGADR
jgi:hypothetical protein